MFVLLVAVFIGSVSVSAAGKTVLTTTEKVALRELPSENAEKIKWIKKGKSVVRLGTEGSWSYVQFGDYEGYVESYKLSGGEDTTLGKKICTCNAMVRVRPQGGSVDVGVIYKGDIITVYGIENGWYRIKYDGQYRYTHNSNYRSYSGSESGSGTESTSTRVMRCSARSGGLIRETMVLDKSKRNKVTGVPYNKIVQILANYGEWYRVSYTDEDGTTYKGFMHKSVLAKV